MRDLSDLPRAKPQRSGLTPDPRPRFAQVLVEQWAAEKDDDKPTALGTPFRHSDAGKCARAIAYTAAGVPRSDPMDLPGVWNTTLGTLIHDKWQAALQARWPDAEVEVTCRTQGADGSGHIDAVIRNTYTCVEDDDHPRQWVTAYELKTVGGFAYKAAIGVQSRGKPAEGPKTEYLLQAAVNGLAVDADEVVVGYLAKECVSAGIAKSYGLDELGRFLAEWTFTREQYEPLALAEAERVAGILAMAQDGTLARRHVPHAMPRAAEIVDVARGGWVLESDGETTDAGSVWQCGYCNYRTLCAKTQPGRVPVDDVMEVAVGLGLTPKEAA